MLVVLQRDLDVWLFIELIQVHKYSSETGLKHLKWEDFLHGSENLVLWFVHVNMTSRSCQAGKVFRDVLQTFLIETDSTHSNVVSVSWNIMNFRIFPEYDMNLSVTRKKV